MSVPGYEMTVPARVPMERVKAVTDEHKAKGCIVARARVPALGARLDSETQR
jgi:hypothetical protein